MRPLIAGIGVLYIKLVLAPTVFYGRKTLYELDADTDIAYSLLDECVSLPICIPCRILQEAKTAIYQMFYVVLFQEHHRIMSKPQPVSCVRLHQSPFGSCNLFSTKTADYLPQSFYSQRTHGAWPHRTNQNIEDDHYLKVLGNISPPQSSSTM